MGQKLTRVSAFIAAVLFLGTSVGFTAIIIWQMAHQNQDNSMTSTQDNPNILAGKPLEGYTPVKSADKLVITDITVGTGKEAKTGSNITANYTGALATTGIVFESSLDQGQPASFGLDQVIKGWQNGVPGMKEGGKRRLIIPAKLAYGDQASATIPANSALVFDIELISVN